MSTPYARGESAGFDAANYAQAYGQNEAPEDEATRRAGAHYTDSEQGFHDYVSGFLAGWERFESEVDVS